MHGGQGTMAIARILTVLALLGLPIVPAAAADVKADVHLGVTSCAGSTCHGAVAPWRDSNVLQNEYSIWSAKDPHSKAYAVLLQPESKRIAANLGLPNAHEAKICLDCHADNVPVERRGVQFQISDGVGCESCHGGAERWLGIHISANASHAANVAAGMFPTEDPVARAGMCLSCHFGDATRFVTHRIYGAGHPRLSFELDTFTAVQPAHYRIDDDYKRRKAVTSGVKTWAIGQAMALERLMRSVADPGRNMDGLFPEFGLYDCQACHTPLTNVDWAPRPAEGIGPGVIRLQDANAAMLRVITAAVAPSLSGELLERSRAVHMASVKDRAQMQQAALRLADTALRLKDAFAARPFDAGNLRTLLNGVLEAGGKGAFPDYASAEQATMALGAMVDSMHAMGLVDAARHKSLQAALEPCYTAVASDATFNARTFTTALQQVQAAIPAF